MVKLVGIESNIAKTAQLINRTSGHPKHRKESIWKPAIETPL